jgi:hypothetical protein
VRGRVEHVTIHRPLVAAAMGPVSLGTGAVRIVEVGAGTDELTLHIDHEVLAVVAVDVGWSWLEADRATDDRITDNAFRLKLGGALRWRKSAERVHHIGLGIARLPGYTPDGRRLTTESRLELAAGVEDKRFVFAMRGGMSWVHGVAGGDIEQLLRYGTHLEAAIKLARHVEVGAFGASSFESPLAGDPWVGERRWNTEAGVFARLRTFPK